MTVALGFALLVALAFGMWSLGVTIFSKKRRKVAARNVGLSLVALVVIAIGVVVISIEEAKQAGFANYSEMQAAKSAGITDPAVWATERERVLAEQAAANKAEAEEKKRTAQDKAVDEQRAAEVARSSCRNDLQCWGDKAIVAASVRCAPYVERFAKFDFKWTDSFLELKFSHFRWKDRANGILTVIGDKIKFQNGFGAWQYATYECDFDPATEAVLDVRVTEGRL